MHGQSTPIPFSKRRVSSLPPEKLAKLMHQGAPPSASMSAKERAAWEEHAIDVLRKHPMYRGAEEVWRLVPWVQSLNCALLMNLEPHVIAELCRTCTLESFDADTEIFAQGDKSDKLFIILDGSVPFYICFSFPCFDSLSFL